jgi:hypothetical protein
MKERSDLRRSRAKKAVVGGLGDNFKLVLISSIISLEISSDFSFIMIIYKALCNDIEAKETISIHMFLLVYIKEQCT